MLKNFLVSILLFGASMVFVKQVEAPNVIWRTDTALEEWIEKLSDIELPKYYPQNHCVIDTNGRLSCSCLQFQKRTFEEMAEKYGVNKSLWKDCETQKILAKRMLNDNWRNYKHWYTSVIVKGLGLPPNAYAEKMHKVQ